jgi:serine/threonine protein kinase
MADLVCGVQVAVKTFEKSKLTESHARKRVAREIRILKALNHPNIIKLYEVIAVAIITICGHSERAHRRLGHQHPSNACIFVRFLRR